MADEPSVTAPLAEVRNEIRVARTIPSTAIVLRQRAVEQAVDYILSDPRFDDIHVSLQNAATLTAALNEVTLDGTIAEFGVYKGTSLTQIAKFFLTARCMASTASLASRCLGRYIEGCWRVRHRREPPEAVGLQCGIPCRMVRGHHPGVRQAILRPASPSPISTPTSTARQRRCSTI